MKSSSVKVSIIVPVYNVEKYIKKCLDSLVRQTLKEIEIIVVNDGSPDNSQKIIDKYVKKYPNKVKSYIQKNGGQGSARNFGLTKATGEYVGYVDSDDFVELDMYERMYNKAKEEKSDIIVCGSYNVNEITALKETDLDKMIFDDMKQNAFFGRMAVWNKIYKKELLTKNNLEFRSKIWYEDVDFTLKALSYAKKITYVNKPFYNYLIREGSTMNNSNIDRNLEILEAFDCILKNKKIKIDKDIIEFLAIDNIYISAVVRIIRAKANRKKKIEIINKLINYVSNNFPDFRNNKYINTLSKNRKIIYKMINVKQYWLVEMIFMIKGR